MIFHISVLICHSVDEGYRIGGIRHGVNKTWKSFSGTTAESLPYRSHGSDKNTHFPWNQFCKVLRSKDESFGIWSYIFFTANNYIHSHKNWSPRDHFLITLNDIISQMSYPWFRTFFEKNTNFFPSRVIGWSGREVRNLDEVPWIWTAENAGTFWSIEIVGGMDNHELNLFGNTMDWKISTGKTWFFGFFGGESISNYGAIVLGRAYRKPANLSHGVFWSLKAGATWWLSATAKVKAFPYTWPFRNDLYDFTTASFPPEKWPKVTK